MSAPVIADSPLRVTDFGKRFGRRWVLRGCSLELRPGAVTALIGPNGAGKSTLMSAAAGLLTADEGRIEVAGQAVTASPSHPDLGSRRTSRCTGATGCATCSRSAGT